jgi:hypothetical protein
MPAIDDIIAQGPVEGEHGWYLSSCWRYVDGTLGVDAFTDGEAWYDGKPLTYCGDTEEATA